mgnify:CR=1 FL=1
MSTVLKELRETLEVLPLSELKQKAVKHFGLRLSKDDTREDVINKIIGVASKQEFASEAVGEMPAPGWSRIKVHPVPGKPQFPFFVGINGWFCWIPINVEVDVPSKVINVLRDAVEHKYALDPETGINKVSLEMSYPFTIVAATPGPDPRPGGEVSRARKLEAKRAFAEENGFWPSDADIKDFRQQQAQAKMLKELH